MYTLLQSGQSEELTDTHNTNITREKLFIKIQNTAKKKNNDYEGNI